MSRETSAGAGKPYGLERVCRVLGFPRSTIYAQQKRQTAKVVPLHPVRRGPKPKVSDIDLLAAIRDELVASPFAGEGHRKVWARLRILRDIRVGRSRVLRLMRENQLLSPHRRPQGTPTLHDGAITTDRPNQMWGTDGIRIETVDEGWAWVFSAVDHCDAYCVGIHAVKIGPHLKNEWVTGTPRLRVKGGRSPEERTLDAQDWVIRWPMAGCGALSHPAMENRAAAV
jgi:hypothetical protein